MGTTNCEQVLGACDKALKSCGDLQKEQKIQIDLYETQFKVQDKFTDDLLKISQQQKEELNKWYRSPLVVFSLGLVVGIGLTAR